MRLVCLGDSICAGYGLAPGAGWVALLAGRLAVDFPDLAVANAGVSGEIAQEGLARLSRALGSGAPDLLYVQFGLNDAAMGIAVPDYLRVMREITRRSLQSGARAVLVGNNHPVCVHEGWDLPGVDLYRRNVRALNEGLRQEFSPLPAPVFFADVERLCESLGEGRELAAILQYDGVHLSEEGNRAYARLLYPLFLERLRALRQAAPEGGDRAVL
ncbi:MAG: GDSL-type esterase/lipase family protein [Desulfovibrio sp.]|jgi:acyl-CoA thioesterase-1|nr:GDSL-type esterase/lipase family protein [Desulfovibrio sp.]